MLFRSLYKNGAGGGGIGTVGGDPNNNLPGIGGDGRYFATINNIDYNFKDYFGLTNGDIYDNNMYIGAGGSGGSSEVNINMPMPNDNIFTISTDNGNYIFNNNAYDSYTYINLPIGTYEFVIPISHPFGFVINDNNLLEVTVTSGSIYEGSETKIIEGITMIYYTGNISVEIKGDYGIISYHCYNHGYMGGQNKIYYSNISNYSLGGKGGGEIGRAHV